MKLSPELLRTILGSIVGGGLAGYGSYQAAPFIYPHGTHENTLMPWVQHGLAATGGALLGGNYDRLFRRNPAAKEQDEDLLREKGYSDEEIADTRDAAPWANPLVSVLMATPAAALGARLGAGHAREYLPSTSMQAGALQGAALFGIPTALTTYALTSTRNNP